MFKRVVWFGIGAAAGAAGTVWAEQRVRRRLDALGPDHLVVTAGNTAKRVGRTVADAVAEGRTTMRDREDELRARRDRRGTDPFGADLRDADLRDTPLRPSHRSPGGRPDRPTRPASW